MNKQQQHTLDIIAAALVIIALVILIVITLPGYLDRQEPGPEPTPINTGVAKIDDESRGLSNFPCLLTAEGC